MSHTKILPIILALSLASCGVLDNPYQTKKIWLKGDPSKDNRLGGLVLDAKQRVIWSPTIPVRTYSRDDPTTGLEEYALKERNIICAEPSPDALTAIAATLKTRGSFESVTGTGASARGEAALARTMTETVEAIGERTQVIQLLRDALYRACEAFANGALDEFGYSLILGQFDLFMLELISADSLGRAKGKAGVATARQTVADAKADLAAANASLLAAESALDDLRAKVRDSENATKQAQELDGPIKNMTTKITTLQGEIDSLVGQLTGQGDFSEANVDEAKGQLQVAEADVAAKKKAIAKVQITSEELKQLEDRLVNLMVLADRRRTEADTIKAQLVAVTPGVTQDKVDTAETAALRAVIDRDEVQAEVNHAKKAGPLNEELTVAENTVNTRKTEHIRLSKGRADRAPKLRQKRADMEKLVTRLAALQALKTQKDAIAKSTPPGITDAESKVTAAMNSVAVARAPLVKARAALATATGAVGPGSTETEVFKMLIERAFDESKTGGGRASAAACLQWFARHPKLSMSAGTLHGKPAMVFGPDQQVPAIARQCAGLLKLLGELTKAEADAGIAAAAARAEAENDLINAQAEEVRARAEATRAGIYFN